jgi:UDP-3-O-[3-hydroxymyristoyl] glucosamine N-acyltransferase
MAATLAELASRFGCRVAGDGSTEVSRVATLKSATPDAISFLANPLYRSALASTAAAAVVLGEQDSAACPVACLITDNPYARYAEIAAFLHPQPPAAAGIDSTASVDPAATVSPAAELGPQVAVGARATIGAGVIVGAGSVIGADVSVGAGTRLAPRVTVLDRVRIGERCMLHSGVVIGADGFGFAPDQGRWIKVPQLGGVVIGDDVEIGANPPVDRGAIDDTVIEDGVKLDNLVQIAHNVRIGAHTVMAAMSGAAGSTTIGKRCMVGGGVVMVGHISICDDVMFTFRSVVTRSVTEPGTWGGSLPAMEASKWRRNAARFRQLDAMQQKLANLVQQIKQLTGSKADND